MIKVSDNIIPKEYLSSFSKTDRLIARFVDLQESDADLAKQRIGQELITNTLPKSLFARSFVDLCDNAFREILENIIVYLGPRFVGEKIFQKAYATKFDKGLKDAVFTEAKDLLGNNKILPNDTKEIKETKKQLQEYQKHNKTLMPVKAAIAVGALAIPLAEYSLSYVKNLFTLKMFKQADFNNIANLNKNKQENKEHQEKVKQSAKKHIKITAEVFAGCLGFATLLATRGKNSSTLNHISEAILAPGSKFFKHNEKRAKFFDKYFGLDFAAKEIKNEAGEVISRKLAISKGQVVASVVAGFFGYTGAAKDRGKQDHKEILYRFPLVGLYAIVGNDLFVKGFKNHMKKSPKYKELFEVEAQNGGKIPKLQTGKNEKSLKDFAEEFAKKNGTTAATEFKKLFKQKTTLMVAPVLFGFTVMGLFVAGCSRYFTQYRYNKDLQKQNNKNNSIN